jgi:hypothetical protein
VGLEVDGELGEVQAVSERALLVMIRCFIKVLRESGVRKVLVKLSQGTASVSIAHTGCAATKGRRNKYREVLAKGL